VRKIALDSAGLSLIIPSIPPQARLSFPLRHWWKGRYSKYLNHSGIGRSKPTRETANKLALIEHIRSRAYELYESREREDGHDLDDWLVAERQVIHHAGKRKPH